MSLCDVPKTRRWLAIGIGILLVGSIIAVVKKSSNPHCARAGTWTVSSEAACRSGGSRSKVGAQVNCAASPHACGYPDATNTGVPPGTVLRRVPQDITSGPGWHWNGSRLQVDAANAVVDSVSVTGSNIVVSAPRATIENSSFSCEYNVCIDAVVDIVDNTDGVLVKDTNITAPTNSAAAIYMYGPRNARFLRLNISKTANGLQTSDPNGFLLQDSYIHDMTVVNGEHLDGFQSSGGGHVRAIHNTILNQVSQTDAVMLTIDPGGTKQIDDTIENNLLAGGGYTIYGGATGAACGHPCQTANIHILDNRISRIYFPNGGSYGPLTAYNQRDSGNQFAGNIWDDTGMPITV